MTPRYRVQPVDSAGAREYISIVDGDIKRSIQKLTIINGSIETVLEKDGVFFARFNNGRCYTITKV